MKSKSEMGGTVDDGFGVNVVLVGAPKDVVEELPPNKEDGAGDAAGVPKAFVVVVVAVLPLVASC